jgi:hypothetical protein
MDISIRAQLRNDGTDNANVQATGLLGRVILTPQWRFVEAGIDVDGLVYIDEITSTANRTELGFVSTDLRPLIEDVVLQFDMVGDSLRLFAWRAGEEMPDLPQVSATTTVVQNGTMGIFNNPPDGNGTATFRYIQVAAIPEPSSGAMASCAMCVIAYLSRRRRHVAVPGRPMEETDQLARVEDSVAICIADDSRGNSA